MSKTWYPVIQYENCVECGACIEKCCTDVYEKNETKPKVVQEVARISAPQKPLNMQGIPVIHLHANAPVPAIAAKIEHQ